MSMDFILKVNPFGNRKNPIDAARIHVHSSGDRHVYHVYSRVDGQEVSLTSGNIVKPYVDGRRVSGHRNFLHLLINILKDIDLDEIGKDYVDLSSEVAEQFPGVEVADYRATERPSEK